jgi:uncharacterized RDD family membrane protein YckC
VSKPTAVAGRRFASFLVDALVICAAVALLWLLLTDKVSREGIDPSSGGFDIGGKRYAFTEEHSGKRTLWLILSIAAVLVVSIVIPAISGSSLGRAVAGIRTVDAQGRPPGFGRALVRWLLWIVDGFFFWLVGGVLVLVTEKNQRVGDMAAGTYTVRKEQAGQPLQLGGGAPAAAYGATGAGAGAGWHPDPHGQARLRWWDGGSWTEHTSE